MSAREMFENVKRERLERLRSVLVEGEIPVEMVLAQSVTIAERVGRGGGEGVLYLTNLRLVFIDDRVGPAFQMPLGDVQEVTTSWIMAPRMRALHVSGAGQRETFWTGKRQAVAMRNAIKLSR
jgi:hypothetical protein